MREILFRGKAITSKKWIYGDLLKYADVAQIWEDTEQGKFNVLVIAETVGQYTGLTDKNGRKIFEGDIIHGNLGNFVVRWSDNISGFVAGEKERTHPCLNRGTMKCYKVIGNIYDNPELVEVEK